MRDCSSSAKKAKPDDLFSACFDEITSQHESESTRSSSTRQSENMGCLVHAACNAQIICKTIIIFRVRRRLRLSGYKAVRV